jgi:hypothetical protein
MLKGYVSGRWSGCGFDGLTTMEGERKWELPFYIFRNTLLSEQFRQPLRQI